jgi:hypothetical protein
MGANVLQRMLHVGPLSERTTRPRLVRAAYVKFAGTSNGISGRSVPSPGARCHPRSAVRREFEPAGQQDGSGPDYHPAHSSEHVMWQTRAPPVRHAWLPARTRTEVESASRRPEAVMGKLRGSSRIQEASTTESHLPALVSYGMRDG